MACRSDQEKKTHKILESKNLVFPSKLDALLKEKYNSSSTLHYFETDSHYLSLAGQELNASASHVLKIKACATTPSLQYS